MVAQCATSSARNRLCDDGLAARVRLEVFARPIGRQRRAHRREQVGAPPHARVHRQRHRNAVLAQLPRRRVPLPGALLALGRHRRRAAARRDALVRVLGQRRGVDVGDVRRHEAVLPHQPDAVVVGRAPHAGVRRHPQAELAGGLERALLGELRIAGDVEGQLQPEHVVDRRCGRRSCGSRRTSSTPTAHRAGCRRRGRTGRALHAARRRQPHRARWSAGRATSRASS